MSRWSLSQRLAAFVTLPALAALAVGWVWLDDRALFLKEGHTVEAVSVLLLLQGILCWFVVLGRDGWREWQVPALLGLFAARELDFDKRFTTSGLLKLRTYTGEAPWAEKLLGAAVLCFSLLVLWRLLRRNAPRWWRALGRGQPHALAVLLAAGLTVAGKTLDGLGRKLLDFGIALAPHVDARAGRAEEWFELAAWWLLALAVALLPAARAAPRRRAPDTGAPPA